MRTAQSLALVLIAGAGGFVAYRLTSTHAPTITVAPPGPAAGAAGPGSAAPPSSPPEAPGEAGPGASSAQPYEDDAPDPNATAATQKPIPETIPDISLVDRDGVRRKLSDWKGRPLLINFWATWCGPCRREIPLLKTLRHEHAADGVEVIGIAVDLRDAVLKYAHDMGIDYPLLIGEEDALQAVGAFGMDTVFPFTVFADKQSRVVTLKIGELHQDEAAFILTKLKEVDTGKLPLPQARKDIAAGIRDLAIARAKAEAGKDGAH
ncbi:MAG TPA: TlpA disulfide reductase family protein [Steroidobacteraceae bacterium]|jgi:thiol-disulfide isomerase/thioredoxin